MGVKLFAEQCPKTQEEEEEESESKEGAGEGEAGEEEPEEEEPKEEEPEEEESEEKGLEGEEFPDVTMVDMEVPKKDTALAKMEKEKELATLVAQVVEL